MDPMPKMAVVCSWADAQLEGDTSLVSALPIELLSLIRRTSGSQYLDAIASATLLPAATDKISAYYRYLLPEITARWLLKVNVTPLEDHVLVLSSLAKVLPFAPCLKPYVKDLMNRSQGLSSLAIASTNLTGLDDKQLHTILLAFFRLFSYDLLYFRPFVHPVLIPSLFKHKSLRLRYLAIQCFSQLMGLADALTEKLVMKHIGAQPIPGTWDGRVIDFRLLKLIEERRWKQQDAFLSSLAQQPTNTTTQTRIITTTDLLPETANLGGVLLPRFSTDLPSNSSLVYTATTIQCLQEVGFALHGTKSILLSGEPGSGKTSLVLEAARELNKSSSLITLHLNEQTDAKSLLGLYTSSEETGSFVWQAGVLTQAIREGRWILIEDIDKAPADVLGVIRPILQDGELYLPSRKETLRAADGFRIFATMRTIGNSSNSSLIRNSWILNDRCWSMINVATPDTTEIRDILSSKYPSLAYLNSSIMDVHQRIASEYQANHALKSATARSPSLRDLLKWCRRTVTRLGASDATHGTSISEASKLDIFKDAVDCYASHLAGENAWSIVADSIAEQMQIAPQQAQHCLKTDLPSISDTKLSIQIGRVIFQKSLSASRKPKRLAPFAFTRQARMTMEKIASATSQSEPVLLVGETGVGKTTLVQHVAGLIGQSITVINLSQQSEASDLLGGLKPVTTRSLMIPVVDEFSALFDETFSAKKNEKFLSSIYRSVGHENWQRVLLLWQQAVQMAETSLQITAIEDTTDGAIRTAKRRKLDTPKYQGLRDRWTAFSHSLNQLRGQVERAERHLTFAYVEGRIVQALRQGGWLLLDEINLASSNTLDSIASLLTETDQERPYLHLTEAGSTERIVAHPDFRVFAAMNPATDTGKKDLTSGIRSRFTEIYVHAGDNDVHDLVNLIETYVGGLLDSDKRAAFDLAKLYLAVKALNQGHRIVDGAGDDPHFTIRSLVRCLLYVQKHAATYGLRRAIFEGSNMSFCTMLSRESERMVLPLIDQHILSGVMNVRAFLAQTPRAPSEGISYVPFKHHLVMKGSEDVVTQPNYIRTPSVERNLLNLARAASMHRFPILLQGPTSSGKTSMVEYLARSTGNQFVRVNNHEHTDLQEYLGSYASNSDGRLEFREGVLVQALRHGHWIALDELNLAPSDVLEALNRLLDDNRELLIPETQELVRPHPGFMLFATQNPAGLYGGRKRLSRAFRNRFLELHFDDIPEDELEVILQKRSQIAPSFCTQIVAVYKKLSLQRQSSRLFEQQNSFATLRDLFRWASRPMDDRTQLATQGFMLLGERVRDSAERRIVKDIIEEVIRVEIDLPALYNHDRIPAIVLNGSVIWTPAMRRLFVLVSTALENNEPVLLVGETGCGKTQICQTVAQAFQHQLNVYNAHTNTETGDLIGSQRPARHRSEADTQLRQQLLGVLNTPATAAEVEEESLGALLHKFDQMDLSTIEEQALADVRASIARHKSLFEWVDGSLVRAMKEGQHFLLDEISLAEDSVLERLNSLLEPSRTILLAEKGSSDNIVVATPGFQFLSTMNPGGDYGKRELSAALRNRLTEIWVPQLAEADDVLPILDSKLSSGLHLYAKAMLDFSSWFRSTFMGATVEAVPLRDLITWANFLQQNLQLDAEIAFCHGAAMVLIDSLGANPAGMMSSVTADVKEARVLCFQKLREITKIQLAPVYDQELTLVLTQEHLRVGYFQIERAAKSMGSTEIVFEAPTTLKNTMRLIRALQMPRPILLEGSPGVGKTAIVTALAHAVGKQLTRINLSDQTDLMDLFGADVPMENDHIGKFVWSDGPLLQAMQAGGWVLLDEMNLASQSVLEGLNSCLDHRQEVFVAELDRSFTCHPDFKLFAAQNPHHQGGGRKGLPKSFVNRFTIVYADPLERVDLCQICIAKFPGVEASRIKDIVNVVSEIQGKTENDARFCIGGPWEFNLRDVSRWLQMVEQTPSLPPDHYFGTMVSLRLRTPYQKELTYNLRGRLSGLNEQASLYHSLSVGVFQVGTSFLNRGSSWQKSPSGRSIPTAILRYAQSIIEAVNRRWPVIIVQPAQGSTTALIGQLAAIAGATLATVSLNADTDTMDLIGGLEQHDPYHGLIAVKAVLQQHSEQELLTALERGEFDRLAILLRLQSILQTPETSLQDLQAHLKELSAFSDDVHGVLLKIEQLLSRDSSDQVGFVWNDGVLVDALKKGQWLVLENANTCNPAVLDRLNSLLEPNGVLIISEQHNSAGSPRTIKPHPDFRIFLTMDPRHGELSRAMRNRSLELYIDEALFAENDNRALSYPCSADVYRIRHLENTSINAADPLVQPSLMGTWMDHTSDADLAILESPFASKSLSLSNEALLQCQLEASKWLSFTFKSQTRTLQEQLATQAPMNEAQLVPHLALPAVNEPLIALSSDHFMKIHTEKQAWVHRLLLRIYKILQSLNQAKERSRAMPRKHQNLLEKSFVREKHKDVGELPFADFLMMACTALMQNVEGDLNDLDANWMGFAESILAFLNDILSLSTASTVGPGLIPAYLQNGYDIVTRVSAQLPARSAAFSTALDLFAQRSELKSGRSLHIMWDDFRPLTATTERQLHDLLRLETLMQRLDNISVNVDSLPYVTKVKQRLVEVYRSLLSGNAHNTFTLNDLDNQFAEIEDIANDVVNDAGHFTGAFRSLIQLSTASYMLFPRDLVSILAKIPTSLDEVGVADRSLPRAFAAVLEMTNGQSSDGAWEAWRDNFGLALLQKILSSEDQPISFIDWTRVELRTLLQNLSSFGATFDSEVVVSRLRYELRKIVLGTLSCHSDLLSESDCMYLVRDEGAAISLCFAETVPPNHYFRTIYQDYLHESLVWLTEGISSASIQHTGAALVAASLGLLRLLVPDQPYDPALKSQIAYTRFQRRQTDIQTMLKAQRIFEAGFTAQKTSLLIRMTERELSSIGDEPEVAAVVRPPVNGLDILAVEFKNLLRSVVKSRPEKILLAGMLGSWHDESVSNGDARTEADKMLQIIEQILKRLKLVDRALDDLTRPIMWILQCLALGIQMLAAHPKKSATAFQPIKQRVNSTPLLSSIPEKVMSPVLPAGESLTWDTETCFTWLEQLAVTTSIEGTSFLKNGKKCQDLLEVTDSVYQNWRTHLQQDQDAAVARSKYYAYRGEDDLDDSQEKQAVNQMFPIFDDTQKLNQENINISIRYDARTIAVRLAKLQERFLSNGDHQADLEAYIDGSLEDLSNFATRQNFDIGPVPSQDLLPLILLKLDDRISSLDAPQRKERLNVYADGDVVEARRLHDLVKSIIANFHRIHAAWPEHAVPVDVIAFCHDTLTSSLKDPIAKLLTKTEKLLNIVDQWQAVASSEYSAAENIDALTRLIIRWRQLELSSWSRLLDFEQQKVEDSARSWYFMLYEAIVSNPRQKLDQNDDLFTYLKELARTLEDFLTSTSCGELPYRLQLCQSFEKLLVGMVAADDELQPVLSCVTNMIRHHERYQQVAESTLAKGRAELEKKLREQIKLASWKDTNVSALRESARRSHFKLFKIVRKYRTLLSQPLQLQAATNQHSDRMTASHSVNLSSSETPGRAVDSALAIAAEAVPDWNNRPERLSNPFGAAARMKLLARRQGDAFTASYELSQFVASLQSSMKDLKSRTPSTLTEENKSQVNHLKVLKQTLLSDTLRFIKQMGVRRDLGGIESEKQMSRAVVLATVPSLTSNSHQEICASADNDFHEILNLMPAVRGAVTEHSEQVRVADVRRSVAYADGLLSILIDQRKAVFKCERHVDMYGVILEKLSSFARQPVDQFEHASSDFEFRQRKLTIQLCWLPNLIQISVKVLRVQMKHAGLELGAIIESLLGFSENIRGYVAHLRSFSPLPRGICLKNEVDSRASVSDLLGSLRHEIEVAIFKHPQSAPILQKLIPWTDFTTAETELAVNGVPYADIKTVDKQLRECLDTIFEAVQQASSCLERMPTSTETIGWLVKAQKRQAEMMDMLRLSEVIDRLGSVEASIGQVSHSDISGGISVAITALPILEQYLMISQYVAGQALELHCETARTTLLLTKTLTTIASEGFCSPQEASNGEEQSGQVESGTGLGDGTGAEDISKDFGDDEDLSELAQMENEMPDGQELEASKDAVNMDKDDLNGDNGDAEQSVGDEDGSSQSVDEEGSDLDEETGSVDNLDPTAIDEKMWEGLDAEKDKELENEKANGEKSDEQTAKQEKRAKGDNEQQPDEGTEEGAEEGGSDADDEGEGVGRDEIDQADANMQEEKPLDLPEEIQLNGEDNGDQDELSDDGMADLSDVEAGPAPEESKDAEVDSEDEDEKHSIDEGVGEVCEDEMDDQESEELEGIANGDDIMEDQPEPEMTDDENERGPRNEDMSYNIDEDQAGEMGESGAVDAAENAANVAHENAAVQKSDRAQQPQDDIEDNEKDKGADKDDGITRGGRSEMEIASPQAEALKKLGDMLERWHQRGEIHQATQDQTEAADDIDMADADFEHMQNEEDRSDAQALGAASKEQARTLDQSKAIEDEEIRGDADQAPADVEERNLPLQENMVERFSQLQTHFDMQQDSGPGAIIPERRQPDSEDGIHGKEVAMEDEELNDDPVIDHLVRKSQDPLMSQADASQLWTHYSAKVQHISLILTEQLRLILAPTLATKLRGDFRTGKRLNIKRIIPYIASGYKRDKIWMRRSVPSKRNYQIMLALDDSKSMMEGGAGALALETLTMLCKSLSMLEVGDLCVVGFGNEEHIRVAHPFGQPFGNEAGVKIFQNFAFNQTATDVKKMVKESIGLFQDARAKSTGGQSELWQLQLIISDGICEDHETVSRLVRQAKGEKIMIVFVIVDGSGESILNMQQASFEPDETGEMKLSTWRYLEKFPFPYYLVVRDVRDLPAVLATALKGWFAQVVDVQG